jgi:hypothetical protein
MGWELAASAAVAALIVKAQAAGGSGCDVFDSLVVTESPKREAVVVAGSVDPQGSDQQYIEHKLSEPGYTSDVEDVFTIWSEVAVLKGSANMADARTRAYQIVTAWGQQIADDPTLANGGDDVVMECWISEVGYRGRQTGNGAKAVLLVGIDCRAYTGT